MIVRKLLSISCILTQPGGACDIPFRANTFEEIAELNKQHGMAMYQKQEKGICGPARKVTF